MRQHEIWPQGDELVDIDVEAHVVMSTLAEHLLVYARPIVAVREVVVPWWTAPAHPHRELDQAGGLDHTWRVDIVRNRNRARTWAQHGASLRAEPAHAGTG